MIIETNQDTEISAEEFETNIKQEAFRIDAITFFKIYTGSVDVQKEGNIMRVYYPMLPYANSILISSQRAIIEGLPLGQPKAKIDCVMERTQNFLADAENEFHFRQIYRDHPIVSLVSKHGDLCENIAFYLVIFICY